MGSFNSYPLPNVPPFLPTGLLALPLGTWTGGPLTYPGTNSLTIYFGLMSSLAVMVGLIADLVLLPACILSVGPELLAAKGRWERWGRDRS